MDENIHNIEGVFKKAYQSYEDEPSSNAWERINAALDKEDADRYKKRFIGWKRIAVLLLFLLSALIIHEAGVFNKQNRNGKLIEINESNTGVNKRNKQLETTIPGNLNSVLQRGEASLGKTQSNELPGNIVIREKGAGPKSFHKINREIPVQEDDPIKPRFEQVEKLVSNNISLRLNELMLFKQPIVTKINTPFTFQASENKKPPAPFKPYWSVTAFASNDWSQYLLDNDEEGNAGATHNEKEKISLREKHEASFSAGIFATKQFTKSIGLRTGIMYSNIAIAISPQEIYAAKEPDGAVNYKYITSSGYGYVKPGFGLPPAIGDSIQSTEAQHNLHTITIPVMVLYKLEKNKFSLSPAVGLSANFITGAKIETEIKDAHNKETVIINRLSGMRNFYVGLLADINIQYNLSRKWALGLAPGFKYALTPITRSNVVKTYPYNFNIGAGITYSF